SRSGGRAGTSAASLTAVAPIVAEKPSPALQAPSQARTENAEGRRGWPPVALHRIPTCFTLLDYRSHHKCDPLPRLSTRPQLSRTLPASQVQKEPAMSAIPRQECLKRLRAQVAAGRPIIGGGAGIGLSAKCAEAGGIDLIIIYNSGRFRMAGRGSLSGLMPYGDANGIVMDMAREVLP